MAALSRMRSRPLSQAVDCTRHAPLFCLQNNLSNPPKSCSLRFMRSRWALVLAICIQLLLSCTLAHADESSEWVFAKPTGRLTELFQLDHQRIEGLPDFQQRLDGELELWL